MNRMGIPQPDYTPDGVLAEIARVVPFFKGATREGESDRATTVCRGRTMISGLRFDSGKHLTATTPGRR